MARASRAGTAGSDGNPEHAGGPRRDGEDVSTSWGQVAPHYVSVTDSVVSARPQSRLKELEREAHFVAGEKFLLTSSSQLREILFGKLRLHLLDPRAPRPRVGPQPYPGTSEAMVIKHSARPSPIAQDNSGVQAVLPPAPPTALLTSTCPAQPSPGGSGRRAQREGPTYCPCSWPLGCSALRGSATGAVPPSSCSAHVPVHKIKSAFVDGILACMEKNIQGISKHPIQITKLQNFKGEAGGSLTISPRAMIVSPRGRSFLAAEVGGSQSSAAECRGDAGDGAGCVLRPVPARLAQDTLSGGVDGSAGARSRGRWVGVFGSLLSPAGALLLRQDSACVPTPPAPAPQHAEDLPGLQEELLVAAVARRLVLCSAGCGSSGCCCRVSQRSGVARKDVPAECVTQVDRERAKKVVYSAVYGAGKERLAACLGVPAPEAARFVESFFQKHKKVREFAQATVAQCRRTGYVASIMGRQRPLPQIWAADPQLRARAERQAVNFVVQGARQLPPQPRSAADLCKMAMVRVSAAVAASPALTARLLAQIHDELLFEVGESQVPELAGKRLLGCPPSTEVPATAAPGPSAPAGPCRRCRRTAPALVRGTMEALRHAPGLQTQLQWPGLGAFTCGAGQEDAAPASLWLCPQVPLTVTLSAGPSWGHLQPLQEARGPGPRPLPESPGNGLAGAPAPPAPPQPLHFPLRSSWQQQDSAEMWGPAGLHPGAVRRRRARGCPGRDASAQEGCDARALGWSRPAPRPALAPGRRRPDTPRGTGRLADPRGPARPRPQAPGRLQPQRPSPAWRRVEEEDTTVRFAKTLYVCLYNPD
ncbi:DNA polymerase nu [Galemys pyrenaicus]|uniref:DNA polymerase nu n=1 Tax=Galemys pyrenaicus TaxID=202257 RepID=A0A8J6DHJ7_GALPY|nr:DNA polymerase nu [Galemys pyrenaicus]